MRWNKCYDQTYLKETYAYTLYRAEGVMAPLTNLCSFDWSGTHMGIYTIVEPVDKLFLEKRLPEEEQGGDLYKCGWPASFTSPDSIGVENENKGEFYVYDLKTNKKTSDHSALKNWLAQLNYSTMTKEHLADLVDMDSFLAYAAVSYFLGNPDDLRNNYNNFYLYLKPDGKAVIIPYDLDRCLGITYEWNPTGNAVTQIDPFTEEMAAIDGIGAQGQQNPLYLYSVVRGGFYVQEYADVLRRVERNELLKPETFARYFDRSGSLYAGEEIPDKTLHNADGRHFPFTLEDGIGGNLSFENYITQKMAFYESCMSKLPEYLAYVQPEKAHCYIRGQFNGWSDHPDYAMKLENGVLSITLTVEENGEFKVYDHLQDRWYGPENMSPDTTAVYFSVGDHNNIYLTRGTYHITFDPLTQQITITYA
jgi:spore coat protein CotH